MRIETAKRPRRTLLPRSWRGWLLTLGLVGLAGVVTVGVFFQPIKRKVRRVAIKRGYMAGDFYPNRSLTDIPVAAGNWAVALARPNELPRLAINIKFRNVSRLNQQRQSAIDAGILTQGDDDFVPAEIQLADRTVRTRLRLKGDLVSGQFDHGSWSFRVHIRGTDHLFGMRRFNLHPAMARDYHSEPLFLQHVRHLGILAPRYRFVRVSLNGDDLGVMAIEEHFSKELLESQGRRESIILKIDESRYFQFLHRDDRIASPFVSFMTGDLGTFRSSRVAASPTLSTNMRVATGKYRAFVEGSMRPSEVFDAKLTGRYLAVVEAWGAWHAASWRNIRFYYNPITTLIEPIAYDAELVSVGHHFPEPLHGKLLADAEIRAAYDATLHAIAKREPWSLPEQALIEEQDRLLGFLHSQFPLLKPLAIDSLAETAAHWVEQDPLERVRLHRSHLGSDTRPILQPGVFRPEDLLQVYAVSADGGRYLELRNLVHFPVVVSGRAAGDESDESLLVPLAVLPATPIGEMPKRVRVGGEGADLPEEVFVSARDASAGAWVRPEVNYPTTINPPIPEPSLDVVSQYEFLEYDATTRTVSSVPGRWEVTGSISLPAGVALVLRPGTELQFEADAVLVVRGPTSFQGTEDARVVLRGRADPESQSWLGMVVLNRDHQANWSFVRVMDTRGVETKDWLLTGGVTLHGGEVAIQNTEFINTTAEDALNLFGTSFALNEVSVRGAVSDGIDIDFGAGTLDGGSLSDIGWIGGGDGLDFSGCHARIRSTHLSRIGDKAISVGERSQVRVEQVRIEDSGAGLVAKDGSYLNVRGAVLRDIRYSVLMAYSKKPEFGGAVVIATDIETYDIGQLGAAQLGSLLKIDGVPHETVDLDVDRLYETIMSKGQRP